MFGKYTVAAHLHHQALWACHWRTTAFGLNSQRICSTEKYWLQSNLWNNFTACAQTVASATEEDTVVCETYIQPLYPNLLSFSSLCVFTFELVLKACAVSATLDKVVCETHKPLYPSFYNFSPLCFLIWIGSQTALSATLVVCETHIPLYPGF